jgi:phosphatidylglycerol---prolipoprotein diacylglyceryl transferase
MHPQFFRIPFLNMPIYGYGLMMVFAFLGCQWLAGYLAKRRGYDPEVFVNATLIALIVGVIGSRMSHVLENWSDFTRPELSIWQNLWNMVNIRSGGLTFYGGLILAAPAVAFYFVYKKIPLRAAMDLSAPCITLGLAIGRIGCFLNGCCYGAQCTLPWAVEFPYGSNAYIDDVEQGKITPPPQLFIPASQGSRRLIKPEEITQGYADTGDPLMPRIAVTDEMRQAAATQRSLPVHPAQLYSTFNSLLITALLLAYLANPHTPGRVFALMLMLEGPTRFLLEMLRVEPPVIGNMSLSMVIGLILLVVGAVLWIAFGFASDRSRAQVAVVQAA